VSLSSVLRYVSVALIYLAFIFLVIGVARTRRTNAGPSLEASIPTVAAARLKIIRRADWRCAAWLLCAALVAYALSLVGTGPLFTEPSGNVAGGFLLIAGIVCLILAALLVFRHVGLHRALRDWDAQARD
jgi:hypothetical protein